MNDDEHYALQGTDENYYDFCITLLHTFTASGFLILSPGRRADPSAVGAAGHRRAALPGGAAHGLAAAARHRRGARRRAPRR